MYIIDREDMSNWWYISKKKKKGPLTNDAVKGLLLSQTVDGNTLFWKEGMDDWKALQEIPELYQFQQHLPPPIPQQPNVVPSANADAGWLRRFFARAFDISLITVLLMAVQYFTPPEVIWNLFGWKPEDGAIPTPLLALVTVPIILLIDSLIYKVFGNTPGKALLGITITDRNGDKLDRFGLHYLRNLYFWLMGTALMTPIVAFVAMIYQAVRLQKKKPTLYDQSLNLQVKAKPLKPLTVSVFTVLFLAISFGPQVFDLANAKTTLSGPPKVWTNPMTGLSVDIANTWKSETKSPVEGVTYVKFTHSDSAAVVGIMQEPSETLSMKEYVAELKEGIYKDVHISVLNSDEKFIWDRETGRSKILSTWRAIGRQIVNGEQIEWRFNVIQWNGSYWRIVDRALTSESGSPHSAKQLSDNLVQTIPDSSRF